MMPLLAEFLGTFLFLFAVAKYGTPLAAGIAFALALFLFGGDCNPAITFMKHFAGTVSQMNVIKTVAVQLLAAYAVVYFIRRY